MTISEARAALSSHMFSFIEEMVIELGLNTEQALSLTRQILKHETTQTWMELQLARLTGAVH